MHLDVNLHRLYFDFNTFVFIIGKFLNHKGRNRKFTNPEELEEQRKQDEEKRR